MSDGTMGGGEARIGSAERDSAVAALRTHLDAGRLTPEEYEDRRCRRPAPAPGARSLRSSPTCRTRAPAPWPRAVASHRPGPRRRLPRPVRGGRETIMAVTPIAALVLFFVTRTWRWFLAIPLAAALLYGSERSRRGPPLPLTVGPVGSLNCGSRPSPCGPPCASSGASSATATAVSSSGSTGPRSPGRAVVLAGRHRALEHGTSRPPGGPG